MAKCPNCNYTLVLHEHRRKYKCSKCGKLFPQKDVDTKEFVEWNKQRRAEEKKKAKAEYNRENATRYQKKNKKKVNAYRRGYSKTEQFKTYRKKYYEQNKEKILAKRKEDYAKHKEEINQRRRDISEQEKIIQNEKRNARRNANIDATRFNSRIGYWRQKQKALTVVFVENELYRAYRHQIDSRLPTISLS